MLETAKRLRMILPTSAKKNRVMAGNGDFGTKGTAGSSNATQAIPTPTNVDSVRSINEYTLSKLT